MADEIDSRLETIRLKEEELEKKHKEILEDELEAKKQGAIVSLKENSAKTESKHRYDDVDLDFDVKDDQKQHSKNPNFSKPKNVRKPTLDKKHLDEIPPDPVNFLREDVDGEKASDGPRPPQEHKQQNNNRNRRNQRPYPPRGNNGNNQGGEKPDGNNQEGRPRQQRPRPPQNRNAHDNNGSNSQNSSTSPRKIHPQALRTERRQLVTETSNNEEQQGEKSPSHVNRPRRPIQKQQPRAITKDGDRNNLTVQITDEVRSVKIKTTERVGSGRVGHNIQAENLEGQESPEKPNSGDGNRNRNKNPRHKRNFKPKPQNPEFQHPILDKIVVTKTSVQERLLRVKSDDGGAQEEPKVVAESNEPAAPEIIESSK